MKVGDKVRVVQPEHPNEGWTQVEQFLGHEGIVVSLVEFFAPDDGPFEGWDVTLDNRERWAFVQDELEVI